MGNRRHSVSRLRGLPVTLLCAATLGLAACGGSGARTDATPTSTAPNTGLTPIIGQNSATPTLFVVGGGGGTVGANEICTADPNVQASVPGNVPAYPGATLLQAYVIDGNGAYGYCAHATTDATRDFYAQQLPAKGWQNVRVNQMSIGAQVVGSRPGFSIVVTMLPDSKTTGSTNILILVSAA